jgi:hypothetical protein
MYISDVRSGAILVLSLVVLHALMQHYHNTRCRGNLFKVIMYSEAPVCRYVRFALGSIEDAAYAGLALLFPAVLAPLTGLLRRGNMSTT